MAAFDAAMHVLNVFAGHAPDNSVHAFLGVKKAGPPKWGPASCQVSLDAPQSRRLTYYSTTITCIDTDATTAFDTLLFALRYITYTPGTDGSKNSRDVPGLLKNE